MKKNYIYLYGAGNRCHALYNLIKDQYSKITVIDNDEKKWGNEFNDEIHICSPDVLKEVVNQPVVITNANSKNYSDILEILHTKYNIKDEYIYLYEDLCWKNLKRNIETPKINKRIKDNNTIILDAYCCQSLGGIEEWLIDLANGLIKRNYNVRILTDSEQAIVKENNREYSDVVNRIGTYEAPEYKENYIALKEYIIGKLPCIIITNRCNVVTMAACDVKEKYAEDIKIISVIHNGSDIFYKRQCIYNKFIDKYVGVAHEMINEMENRGIEEKKLSATTLPFECEANLQRVYTLKKTEPIQIGYAGRLDRIKNGQKRMDLLLDIIRGLIKKKINFHMNFAGDGPAKNNMEEILVMEGMESYVDFWGKIERNKISNFWKKMDIGLNMADYEGRCISKLEMMANGVIPIFTNVTGAREDIINGVNGYIIPMGNVDAAIQHVEYLEKNRYVLTGMGNLAHDSVVGKSDKDLHYDFWTHIFEEMVFEK